MPGLFSQRNLVLCDMQGNNYGLLMRTIKKFPKSLFGQPDGFSLLTGTKFAVRLIELPFTLQHDRDSLTLIWLANITLNDCQPCPAQFRFNVEMVSVTYYITLYVGAKRLVFHLSPRDGHVIIVSGCLIWTAVNLIVLGSVLIILVVYYHIVQ